MSEKEVAKAAKAPPAITPAVMKEANDLANKLVVEHTRQPEPNKKRLVPTKPRPFARLDATGVPADDLIVWYVSQLPEDARDEMVLFGFTGVEFTIGHLRELANKLG